MNAKSCGNTTLVKKPIGSRATLPQLSCGTLKMNRNKRQTESKINHISGWHASSANLDKKSAAAGYVEITGSGICILADRKSVV